MRIREVKNRITAVGKIRQITAAMKMVATVKLRHAQEAIVAARPYAARLEEVIARLAARTSPDAHELLATRESDDVGILVISSDRGLCGAFNTNIFRQTDRIASEIKGRAVYFLVGTKAVGHYERLGVETGGEFAGALDEFDIGLGRDLSQRVAAAYLEGHYSKVILVYNEFKSASEQQVVAKTILPMEPATFEGPFQDEMIYEPSEDEVLDALLPRHLAIQVYTALLESQSAEQAARMLAMEAATDNADEMVADFTLLFNRARQATITKEISEIVGGAEALK